jgi:hypothetical protein
MRRRSTQPRLMNIANSLTNTPRLLTVILINDEGATGIVERDRPEAIASMRLWCAADRMVAPSQWPI